MSMLVRMFVVLALGILCGCSGKPSEHPQSAKNARSVAPDGDLVYTTETEVGLVRGGKVVARLPRGRRLDNPSFVPLTKDGRFLYSVGDTSVSVLDVRSLERHEIPCDSACRGPSHSQFPLVGSMIGWLDAGGADGETSVAVVKALDLAADDPRPATQGKISLAFPHPARPDVQPYSFFLDAASGEYLFLDFAPNTSAYPRPWGKHQILHLARLDGTLLDLGDYSFPTARSVWGAFSPDGRQFAVGDWNYQDAVQLPSDPSFHGTGVNLFDASTGEKTTLAPPFDAKGPCEEPGADPWRYTALRAWWGRNGTLYATFQQWPCAVPVPGKPGEYPPPTVWAYRDGQWSRVSTPGPAIQALELGEGRLAVIESAHSTQTGFTTEYDTTQGSLVIVDSRGGQTHIADGVTALAGIPPTGV